MLWKLSVLFVKCFHTPGWLCWVQSHSYCSPNIEKLVFFALVLPIILKNTTNQPTDQRKKTTNQPKNKRRGRREKPAVNTWVSTVWWERERDVCMYHWLERLLGPIQYRSHRPLFCLVDTLEEFPETAMPHLHCLDSSAGLAGVADPRKSTASGSIFWGCGHASESMACKS